MRVDPPRGGQDPGFLIGGLPKNFEASFRLPRSASSASDRRGLPLLGEAGAGRRRTPFVVEGDEYDTAFFEKTPKFWHYQPEVGVVTVDGARSHRHLPRRRVLRGGVPRVRRARSRRPGSSWRRRTIRGSSSVVSRSARAEVAWFALEGDDTHGQPPHWLAAPAEAGESGQSFDLYAGGVLAGRFALQMPGHHNVRNAIAAIAAAAQGFGVPLSTATTALAGFTGVRRRQDLLFEARGVRVYDDFAHHPTAVDETLRALRSRHPGGALWAVFEPRSATACRALHQEPYARAFDAADRVVLAPLGRPDIAAGERLDLGQAGARPRAPGASARRRRARWTRSSRAITRDAREGDTIALLVQRGVRRHLREAPRRAVARGRDERARHQPSCLELSDDRAAASPRRQRRSSRPGSGQGRAACAWRRRGRPIS